MEYKKLPLDKDGKLIKNEFGIRSPRNLVIVKYPKSGSTLSMCNTKNILIADSEGGTHYFSADNVADLLEYEGTSEFISTPSFGYIPASIFQLVDELKAANNMKNYWQLYHNLNTERDGKKKLEAYEKLLEALKKMPFPILAVDTITSITRLSNAAALYEYNLSVKTPKTDIKKTNEYGGVQYIRQKFSEIKRFIELNAAPFIQYHGHIGAKKKILKKGEEEISAVDIALEGLLANIFTSQADAVCIFYRNEQGCFLDFQKKDEGDTGSRPIHLSNKVLKIADTLKEGDLYPKNYWSEVYPELTF